MTPSRHGRSRALRVVLGAAISITTATAIGLAGALPAQAATGTTYPGARPAWAKTSADAGTAPAATTYDEEVGLALRDPAGAAAFANAVSTPGSPAYGHYLSPKQWIDRYAPSEGDFRAVLDYLKSYGVQITGLPDSRLFIAFRATAAQIDEIFGADLHLYHYRGQKLAAPSRTPHVASSVARFVSSLSLSQGRIAKPASQSASSSAPAAGTPATISIPCSDYWGQHHYTLPEAFGRTSFPTAICGYHPAQIRSAYGIPSGLTGAGQTVAIVDAYASPTMRQDLATWSSGHGVPQLRPGQYREITPGTFYDEALCEYPSGWQGEEALDTEAVHGVASAARILYVGGYNCGTGLDVATSRILDHRLANVISHSYGDLGELTADEAAVNENQWMQAAAEGIGNYFSSGDEGDDTQYLTAPSANYPASSPWVTAVGGTSVAIGANGRIVKEAVWGTHRDQVDVTSTGALAYDQPVPGDFWAGSGGGVSTVFAEPSYQRGAVPSSLAGGMRAVPDVSAVADPYTGYEIGLRPITDDSTLATGPFELETYGGTSLSSPIVAAEVALTQQKLHRTVGFANPALYATAKAKPGTFRDIVPATSPFVSAFTSPTTGISRLITTDLDTSFTARRGYDDVTGLGEITFGGFCHLAW